MSHRNRPGAFTLVEVPALSKTKRAAFTLVEVLVVIGIIALLVAVLIPIVGSARKQGNAARCLSNVRQIATAAFMYAQENKFYVTFIPGASTRPARDRKELLFPYLRQGLNNNDTTGDTIWHCPANEQPHLESSYGFNTNLNGVRLEAIRSATETVALCDAGLADRLQNHPAPRPPDYLSLATHCWPPGRPASDSSCRPNHLRHPKQTVCVGFVDGHAERLPMQKPFYPGIVRVWVPPEPPATNEFDANYVDQLWDLK